MVADERGLPRQETQTRGVQPLQVVKGRQDLLNTEMVPQGTWATKETNTWSLYVVRRYIYPCDKVLLDIGQTPTFKLESPQTK